MSLTTIEYNKKVSEKMKLNDLKKKKNKVKSIFAVRLDESLIKETKSRVSSLGVSISAYVAAALTEMNNKKIT